MDQKFINFYDHGNEEKRLDAKHRNIEFLTTEYCISNFINKEQLRILDVGAGTGKYSFHFANQGHYVTALELFPKHVKQMKEKLNNQQNDIKLKPYIGDARDLSDYEDESFEIVMCLGPLYHIRDDHDREKCVSECIRVLKPNGFLFIAYINKYAAYLQNINNEKSFLNIPYEEMIDNKKTLGFERDIFYFTSPDEIESLFNQFRHKAEIIENTATDGLSYLMRERLKSLSEEEYKLFYENFLKMRNERSMLGSSLHGLLIGRKLS